MRTMLIPLILVCSLAQFAIADPIQIPSGDCGTTYTCYAPKKCLDNLESDVRKNKIAPRCDPENLEYISEFNEKKLYKKIQRKAGEYFCDKIRPYTFESDQEYEEITKIDCKYPDESEQAKARVISKLSKALGYAIGLLLLLGISLGLVYLGYKMIRQRRFERHLMDALGQADIHTRRNGLMDVLEMKGLTDEIRRRAFTELNNSVYAEEPETILQSEHAARHLRICLALIALHHATTPLSDELLRAILSCVGTVYTSLRERRGDTDFASMCEAIFADDYALPFIFRALPSLQGNDLWDAGYLLSELLNDASDADLVKLLVRYYPLMPAIIDAALPAKGHGDIFSYSFMCRSQFAGIVATTPSLLDVLLTAVNDDEYDVGAAYHGSREALEHLLANLLTSPALLENVLNRGVLTAVVRVYAHPAAAYLEDNRDVDPLDAIRAVLELFPEWIPAVKEIAVGSPENNEVIEFCLELPPKRVVIDYKLAEDC